VPVVAEVLIAAGVVALLAATFYGALRLTRCLTRNDIVEVDAIDRDGRPAGRRSWWNGV
jgi:hypothetical protein